MLDQALLPLKPGSDGGEADNVLHSAGEWMAEGGGGFQES